MLPVNFVTDELLRDMSTLGITENPFSETLLKVRYREKCFQFHPDVSQEETEEEMKKINAAYARLQSIAKMDFDEISIVKKRAAMPEDIFRLWEPCRHCDSKGYFLREIPDIQACPDCPPKQSHMLGWLFFIELIRGEGYHRQECPSCAGKGLTNSGKECNRCAGTGQIKVVCKTCNGKGIKRNKENYIKETCKTCNGLGKIEAKPFNPVILKGAVLNKN